MDIFYCQKCGKWYDVDQGHYPVIKEATWEQPEEQHDDLHCNECNNNVEQYCHDDAVELLNSFIKKANIETK